MRALITGSGGFAGGHLADHLRTVPGLEVIGVVLEGECSRCASEVRANLADPDQAAAAVRDVRPDLIFHLAAQAAVGLSWSRPRDTLFTNIGCQLNLLEGVLAAGQHPRILIIGSADEYGIVHADELPIAENNPLRPNSPYAVSKVAQDMLGYQYFLSHNLHLVRVRPFNHIGPGQSDLFAASAFARQIAEIEARQREPVLLVGNLTAKRDFTDVRDIVRGYSLVLERGEPGEVYNLGSGRSIAMSELLQKLLACSRESIEVREDASRLRPSDNAELLCDATKVREATGWEPAIPLEKTLKDILNYWRERVGRGGS
jgi:GDP-4-dehydro-6-deoxy-D-mannose reductase